MRRAGSAFQFARHRPFRGSNNFFCLRWEGGFEPLDGSAAESPAIDILKVIAVKPGRRSTGGPDRCAQYAPRPCESGSAGSTRCTPCARSCPVERSSRPCLLATWKSMYPVALPLPCCTMPVARCAKDMGLRKVVRCAGAKLVSSSSSWCGQSDRRQWSLTGGDVNRFTHSLTQPCINR